MSSVTTFAKRAPFDAKDKICTLIVNPYKLLFLDDAMISFEDPRHKTYSSTVRCIS